MANLRVAQVEGSLLFALAVPSTHLRVAQVGLSMLFALSPIPATHIRVAQCYLSVLCANPTASITERTQVGIIT